MRAIRYHEVGGPDVLRWEEIPDPPVGDQDVLIEVAAAGVNFADLMRRSGRYHVKSPLPAMLGTEAAGAVREVGPRVTGFRPGDRVFCRSSVTGCQAELVAVPDVEVFRMPAACSFAEAAAIPVIFLTAYHMLKTLAPVHPSESVLIHAAASGVGTGAVQLARAFGARVFATASTDGKLALVKALGAEECINYQTQDFVSEVMRRTDGAGVGRVLDCVGGDVTTKSLEVLAPGGRLFIYGRASGSLPRLSADAIFAKNVHVIGLNIGGKPWTQDQHRAALSECVSFIEAGTVRPVISATFPMARVAEAHQFLAARRTMGKVILVPR